VAGLKYTDFDLYRMRAIQQSGAVSSAAYDERLDEQVRHHM